MELYETGTEWLSNLTFIYVLCITLDKTVKGIPIQLKETGFQRSPPSPHDTIKISQHKNKTWMKMMINTIQYIFLKKPFVHFY